MIYPGNIGAREKHLQVQGRVRHPHSRRTSHQVWPGLCREEGLYRLLSVISSPRIIPLGFGLTAV